MQATKSGVTQQRILDAATEVFATRGFIAATMADVVASSGAPSPTQRPNGLTG
jgi:AcrR family transcriptional regulator